MQSKIVPALLCAIALVAISSNVSAKVDGDSVSCASGQPCINDIAFVNGDLSIVWSGEGNYDAYNFRWSRPGKDGGQHEIRGGRGGQHVIRNAHPGVSYRFSVQGCKKHFASSSSCTDWETQSYTPGQARNNAPPSSSPPQRGNVAPYQSNPQSDPLADQYGYEANINRMGSDYSTRELEDPGQCQRACLTEGQCKAWTWVKRGIQGANAKCWLKYAVPAPTRSDCCVSGLK